MKKWLAPLAVLSLVLVTAVVIVAFSLKGDDSNTSEQSVPVDWQLVEASLGSGGFSIQLPPGWELTEKIGIDSYIGEIVGDGVRLHFDYGWYSSSIADVDDPQHIVTYEDIGGRRAKLVRPRQEMEGYVGVYFENFDGSDLDIPSQNRLQISGRGLTLGQEQTAFEIFRSIRGLNPINGTGTFEQPGEREPASEQQPIRSDEGIDPNECNLVHNITACEGNPRVEDPICCKREPVYVDGEPEPSSEQPPIRSDEGIDPNECNLVHNITACEGKPTHGDPTYEDWLRDHDKRVSETLDIEGEADETDTTPATWTRWTASPPERTTFFPQGQLEDGETGERVVMEALLFGELVEVEGCLRVNHSSGVTSHLLIWPPDFTLSTENNAIKVLNAAGQIVARVGDELLIGGGAVGEYTGLPSPDQCPGPYWIVGDEVGTAQATDESDSNPGTN